jgi:hypothetical protein
VEVSFDICSKHNLCFLSNSDVKFLAQELSAKIIAMV